MKSFLHIVSDYGTGDPAFGEVIQRLKFLIYPEVVQLYPTSVPAFNTIATGFWIYQYGMAKQPPGMMIYSNTAPRKEKREAMEDNQGEHLVYAELSSGAHILGVNAGYTFSFVKPHISSLRIVHTPNQGSQFRSRDFYPNAVASLLSGDTSCLGDALDPTSLKEIPEHRIAWIDGYGNCKTTIRKSELDLSPGEEYRITIQGVERIARITGTSFSVAEGELAFSPGSSGHEDPFMELFLRGGSATAHFNQCPMGAHITIAKK